jgi:hypothetical protein
MNGSLKVSVVVSAFLTLGVAIAPAQAFDFNEQHLVAACTPLIPDNGRPKTATVTTANGPGVRHRASLIGDVFLYCQLDIEEPNQNYFNWLQVVADDNTASGSVTATLYRQDILNPAPPVAMYSVTTANQAGVQIASNAGLDDSLNEYQYVYWIEVKLSRSSSSANVTVYSVALMDVL